MQVRQEKQVAISTVGIMTESYEDGYILVKVRAQVMTRDDSTGGWVPMGGGGLSNVSVCKRPAVPCDVEIKFEYFICGKRISDQHVVLSCFIKKDFEYNKVMPTFHHWKTGEKKFGLTFQTAADARAFDKGLRTAVDELLDGFADPSTVHSKHSGEVGDDDVFMTLNLPVERGDSRSSSDSSNRASRHPTPPQDPGPLRGKRIGSEHDSPPSRTDYSYVQLTSADLMYPSSLDDAKLPTHDSSTSIKKRSLEVLPKKEGRKLGRSRCHYCQELYLEEENTRGACDYAPDCVRRMVEEVACMRCARAMLYHCMSDSEGDFAQHPCEDGCGRRWVGLALLSLVVPCLWLYPPLRACHWCAVRCGVCGGRHRPAS